MMYDYQKSKKEVFLGLFSPKCWNEASVSFAQEQLVKFFFALIIIVSSLNRELIDTLFD